MTPTTIAVAACIIALWTLAALLAIHRARRRIPPPDAPSDHYDNLTERLRLAHERSADRTAALNRDLEELRGGRGRGYGKR